MSFRFYTGMVNNKTTIYISIFCSLIVSIILGSCSSQKSTSPRVLPEEVTIKRFEIDLYSLDTNNLEYELGMLLESYPVFAPIFFNNIIGIPVEKTDLIKSQLFDPFYLSLKDSAEARFSDFSKYEKDFGKAFGLIKYYWKDAHLPEVITYISGFEIGAFTGDDKILGVGLDFHLGSQFDMYPPQVFPAYLRKYMTESHLVPRAIHVWLEEQVPQNEGNQLIDFMVRNGKVLYLKEKLLPDTEVEYILEFSTEELAWIRENESQLWAFLLENELLYSVDYKLFQKLINYSPNGMVGMPPDAPGRVGNYIGWKIVSRYMSKKKTEDLNLLIKKDNLELFQESNYKPAIYSNR